MTEYFVSLLKGWGSPEEPVNKEKFETKIFFSDKVVKNDIC